MSPHKKDADHRFRSRSPLILMGAGVTGNAMTGGVLWITPAYAGKSDRGFPGAEAPEDHPRVCGEKLYLHCEECGATTEVVFEKSDENTPSYITGKVIE